jgi:hypothetical protein
MPPSVIGTLGSDHESIPLKRSRGFRGLPDPMGALRPTLGGAHEKPLPGPAVFRRTIFTLGVGSFQAAY